MLRCDEDTDEVIVSIDRRDPRCSEPPPSCVAALIGMCVVDAWELWNHRGFCDGFRIRCRSDAQYRTLQVEVAASAGDLSKLNFVRVLLYVPNTSGG